MDKIFDINYYKVIRWLIMHHLRQTVHMAWLNVVTYGHSLLYQKFLRSRKANLYRLMITPQVCYLERMLNDRFDFTQRRIRIDDAVWHLPWYVYQDAELKDEHIYVDAENTPVYVYTDGEAGALQDDFVVLVPAAILFNADEMKGLLLVYKLIGTRFKIEIV